jgi:hypothetical protein
LILIFKKTNRDQWFFNSGIFKELELWFLKKFQELHNTSPNLPLWFRPSTSNQPGYLDFCGPLPLWFRLRGPYQPGYLDFWPTPSLVPSSWTYQPGFLDFWPTPSLVPSSWTLPTGVPGLLAHSLFGSVFLDLTNRASWTSAPAPLFWFPGSSAGLDWSSVTTLVDDTALDLVAHPPLFGSHPPHSTPGPTHLAQRTSRRIHDGADDGSLESMEIFVQGV